MTLLKRQYPGVPGSSWRGGDTCLSEATHTILASVSHRTGGSLPGHTGTEPLGAGPKGGPGTVGSCNSEKEDFVKFFVRIIWSTKRCFSGKASAKSSLAFLQIRALAGICWEVMKISEVHLLFIRALGKGLS